MRHVTTALDVLAVLMVVVACIVTGVHLLGVYGLALGLVVGAFLVAGASASAEKKTGGAAP